MALDSQIEHRLVLSLSAAHYVYTHACSVCVCVCACGVQVCYIIIDLHVCASLKGSLHSLSHRFSGTNISVNVDGLICKKFMTMGSRVPTVSRIIILLKAAGSRMGS